MSANLPSFLRRGQGVVVEAGFPCRYGPTTPPSANEKRSLETVSVGRLSRPESNPSAESTPAAEFPGAEG
jgi:hypothetical protein